MDRASGMRFGLRSRAGVPRRATAVAATATAVVLAVAVCSLASGLAASAATPKALTEAWHSTYDGPAHKTDTFHGVVVTAGGEPVAAGYATGKSGHGTDLLLLRFSTTGARKWTRLWNGPASGNDRAMAIVRDDKGYFYVVGVTAGRGGDLLVMRYSSSGALRWSRRYDSGHSQHDEGLFVAVDGSRNAYVVGTSKTKAGVVWRLVKYDAYGKLRWVRSHASSAGDALPGDVADNGKGTVFVTGTYDTASEVRATTRAYSSSGALKWKRTYDLGTVTRGFGVSWAPDGVYVAVSRLELGEIPVEARIVKHGPGAGGEVWSRSWTTVPGAAPYEFRDVVALPYLGAAAVGDYALLPGMGACLFYCDTAGTTTAAETWADAALESAAQFAVADAANNAWSVGFHGYHLTVVRYTPGAGSTNTVEYAGHTYNSAQAAAAQGDQALYVVGTAQNPGGSMQALIVRVTP